MTQERPWVRDEPIPVAEWGKDHWSTLAYIETRCVDHRGEIDNDRMRCNPRRHRKALGTFQRILLSMAPASSHPTILRGDLTVTDHDDWDCLNDLITAGLVELVSEVDRDRGAKFGGISIIVRLTDSGESICDALRRHKARGGNFAGFAVHPWTEEQRGVSSATQENS